MTRKPFLTVKTRLPTSRKLFERLGVDKNGDVQNFATDEILKRLTPYIPYQSGSLRASASKESSTRISVKARYARAQFFGVTKKGEPFDYNTTGNPKAGSHWDKRLVSDEGEAIVAKLNRYAGIRKRGI